MLGFTRTRVFVRDHASRRLHAAQKGNLVGHGANRKQRGTTIGQLIQAKLAYHKLAQDQGRDQEEEQQTNCNAPKNESISCILKTTVHVKRLKK